MLLKNKIKTEENIRHYLYDEFSDEEILEEEETSDHVNVSGDAVGQIIGRRSSSVVEHELALYKKKCRKWRRLADRYYKEKKYLLKEIQKERREVLKDLWTFKTVHTLSSILRMRGYIALLLTLNAFLLGYIIVSGFTDVSPTSEKLVLASDYPYTLQMAELNSFEEAQSLAVKFKEEGLNAYIGKIFQNQKELYRVYVGEFANTNSAYKYLKKIQRKHSYQDSFVRRKY